VSDVIFIRFNNAVMKREKKIYMCVCVCVYIYIYICIERELIYVFKLWKNTNAEKERDK